MTQNERLYKAALDAINKLFGDRTVSSHTCRENLIALRGEIEILLEAIEGDIAGDTNEH